MNPGSVILLSPCPTPVPRETFLSFFSGLAAVKGASAQDFAYDLGLSFKRVLGLDREALDGVAKWGRLSSEQLHELLSWMGQRAGNVRMHFRGEIFISRALRSPTLRGCPTCLREDALAHDGPSIEAMAMRGDWQLRETTLCLRHSRILVPLWRKDAPLERYDFAVRLTEILDGIMSGDLDGAQSCVTDHDLWLDQRLATGADVTWLSDQALFPSVTFCRLLGMELLRLLPPTDPDLIRQLRAAQAAGFDVAGQREEAISIALDRLAKDAGRALDEPQKAFGKLYVKLKTDYQDDDSFASFRRCVRNCILRNWPIVGGEVVLGEVLPERLLHSLFTAARDCRMKKERIETFLIEVGALDPSDDRPPNKRTFDAKKYAALLEDVTSLVSLKTLREAMGASRSELTALITDGVLTPVSRVADARLPWRLSDGLDLISELEAMAVLLEEPATGWEATLFARNRSGLGIDQIIAAVRSGRVRLGRHTGPADFSGLLVRKDDMNEIAREAAHDTGAVMVSSAEFGREVGLRDAHHLEALFVAGHLMGTRRKNPKTGRLQIFMSKDDIAAFHTRFATIWTMSNEREVDRNSIRSWIKAAKLRPFSPNGEDFGLLFLRDAFEAVVR
jgi:hypothetical protein